MKIGHGVKNMWGEDVLCTWDEIKSLKVKFSGSKMRQCRRAFSLVKKCSDRRGNNWHPNWYLLIPIDIYIHIKI
jgi:hypothetical protein